MSVKIDESGRRSVQVEVEVPGTPEQVWQAIATGPGVSAWFVPTEIEERVGGKVVVHFGPGMDSASTVKEWDPPHRFAAEGDGYSPTAPPLATEWTVEARSGGTCVVRVVHSLFASTDEWDDQLGDTENGWPTFFRILELYLEHFAGQPSASLSAIGMAQGDVAAVWEEFARDLGIEAAAPGQRVAAGGGAPRLAGVVEPLAEIPHGRRLLLRLDEPTSGAALLGVYNCGGVAMGSVNVYFYGDEAAQVVERDEPAWRAWMEAKFPTADAASPA